MLMIRLFFNYGKTVKEVQTKLQDDFDTLCKWLYNTNMHIYTPKKTKVVAFGHRKYWEMMSCQ